MTPSFYKQLMPTQNHVLQYLEASVAKLFPHHVKIDVNQEEAAEPLGVIFKSFASNEGT